MLKRLFWSRTCVFFTFATIAFASILLFEGLLRSGTTVPVPLPNKSDWESWLIVRERSLPHFVSALQFPTQRTVCRSPSGAPRPTHQEQRKIRRIWGSPNQRAKQEQRIRRLFLIIRIIWVYPSWSPWPHRQSLHGSAMMKKLARSICDRWLGCCLTCGPQNFLTTLLCGSRV